MIYLCLLFILLSISLYLSSIHSITSRFIFATLFFISILSIQIYGVSDYLTGEGVNDAVIYHLHVDLREASISDFSKVIITSACIFILVLWSFFRILNHHEAINLIPTTLFKYKNNFSIFGFLIISIAANPLWTDLFLMRGLDSQNKIPREAVQLDAIQLKNKKNIIYLYLEGVERTFLDQEKFPGLMPNLLELERYGLSFHNIKQISGTGWTIAGMVASQCGIPLFRDVDGDLENTKFLPGANCLGDLLKKEGYQLHFLGGASLKFANKGNFLRQHGFSTTEGWEELAPKLPNTSEIGGWGVHDDDLYEVAKNRINALNRTKNPYAFFMLTVDTHTPAGHESKGCKNFHYLDGKNSMLNAVHCADRMAGDLIRKIISSKEYENTILVVGSDHLMMKNPSWDVLKRMDRGNLLIIFDKDRNPQPIKKLGSTLDISPTLMNLLGAGVGGNGLGKDLLGSVETLMEKYGAGANAYIRSINNYFSELWGFFSLQSGIEIIPRNKKILVDGKEIDFPVLLKLDKYLKVVDSIWETSKVDLRYKMLGLSEKDAFIWVDNCNKIAAFSRSLESADEGSYCFALGRSGAKKIQLGKLKSSIKIAGGEIARAMDGTSAPIIKNIRNQSLIKNIELSKAININGKYLNVNNYNVMLRSAGFGAGNSFIEWSKNRRYIWGKPGAKKIYLTRGITVVGFMDDMGPPRKLAHFDSCNPKEPFVDKGIQTLDSIDDVIKSNSAKFESFVVMVNDSAKCDFEVNFKKLFSNSGLVEWTKIDLRTPYIGIISNKGIVREYFGLPSTALIYRENILDGENKLDFNGKENSIIGIYERSMMKFIN